MCMSKYYIYVVFVKLYVISGGGAGLGTTRMRAGVPQTPSLLEADIRKPARKRRRRHRAAAAAAADTEMGEEVLHRLPPSKCFL